MKKPNSKKNREILKTEKGPLYNALNATEDKLSDFWERSSPGLYTNHGKSHIESVEYYVNELIGEKRFQNLSPEEFYILLMGVLCHDVGMILENRTLHNVESYKYVISNDSNKVIIVPNDNYYRPIALLCLGHRDYEDKHTLTDSCIIDDEIVKMEETITINHTNVHLKYLAAILRLADELDVTDIRTPENILRYYESFNAMPADIKDHWEKGEIIENVYIDSYGSASTIHLVPNYNNIRKLSDKNNVQKDHYLKIIFDVKEKIEKEIEQINPITFSTKSVDDQIGVQFDIVIDYDNNIVSDSDYQNYKRYKEKKLIEQNQTDPNKGVDGIDSQSNNQKESPRVTLTTIIEEFRRDRNLLETGRFMYSFGGNNKEEKEEDEKYNEYTQFFINTQLLLTNRDALNSITDIFEEQFKGKKIDCVIGIGKAGIILAPNLSLKLECNSTYVICGWEGSSSVNWEKGMSVIKDANNVLVLLDVISTGTATRLGIEKIKEIKEKTGSNLGNIYIGTIFCTNKKIVEELEKEDKVKEMYYIRDDFQFKTYKYDEYMRPKNEEFRKGLELLPIRKK